MTYNSVSPTPTNRSSPSPTISFLKTALLYTALRSGALYTSTLTVSYPLTAKQRVVRQYHRGSQAPIFTLQGKRWLGQEYWAYDTTTLSSYSETLRHVQYGYNKEHDPLPQLKLALVFGQESNLPFYFRKLAGNITDSKTIRHLLSDLEFLGHSKIKLVMDRGCYSEENINSLFRDHVKFLVSVKMSLSFIRTVLDTIYDTIRDFEHYNEDYELYCQIIRTTWNYAQKRPYKSDTLPELRRLYIHYYYNIARAADDEQAFNRQLFTLKQELETGERVPEHEKLYQKYFAIKTTPKRGTQATVREEAIRKAKRYYGFLP